MLPDLVSLEKNLAYDYQKKALQNICKNFNLNDEDCLDVIYRLTCNLFVLDSQGFSKKLTDLCSINNVDRNNGLLWPFIQNIFFIKILTEADLIARQELVNFILYGNNISSKELIESRIKKIESGIHVKNALKKLKKINKNDVNWFYVWSINLLVKQVQRDIYLNRDNLNLLNLNQDTIDNISNMKSILSTISSLDGD